MFKCILRGSGRVAIVYEVDYEHNSFLIDSNGKFRWISIDDCIPFH